MHYVDTIVTFDAPHLRPDYRQHFEQLEGLGDSTVPRLEFTGPVEATIAAFLLETLTSSNNPIAREITGKLGCVVTQGALEAEVHDALVLESLAAQQVRRTIKEVAEGDPQLAYPLRQIPKSVILAAQYMHYGPDALEPGSTQPTPLVPAGLDTTQEVPELKHAIEDIGALQAGAKASHDHGAPHSAEFAAIYHDQLISSLELPIAA